MPHRLPMMIKPQHAFYEDGSKANSLHLQLIFHDGSNIISIYYHVDPCTLLYSLITHFFLDMKRHARLPVKDTKHKQAVNWVTWYI